MAEPTFRQRQYCLLRLFRLFPYLLYSTVTYAESLVSQFIIFVCRCRFENACHISTSQHDSRSAQQLIPIIDDVNDVVALQMYKQRRIPFADNEIWNESNSSGYESERALAWNNISAWRGVERERIKGGIINSESWKNIINEMMMGATQKVVSNNNSSRSSSSNRTHWYVSTIRRRWKQI